MSDTTEINAERFAGGDPFTTEVSLPARFRMPSGKYEKPTAKDNNVEHMSMQILKSRNIDLEARLRAAMASLQKAEKATKKADDRIMSLESGLFNAEADNEEANSRIMGLESSLFNEEANNEQANKQIRVLAEAFEGISSFLSPFQQRIVDMGAAMIEQFKELLAAKQEISRLNAELRKKDAELRKKDEELYNAHQTIGFLAESLDESQYVIHHLGLKHDVLIDITHDLQNLQKM